MAHSWTLGDFNVDTASGQYNMQNISDNGWIVAQDVEINGLKCIYCDQSIGWAYPRSPHRIQDITFDPNHDCPNAPVDPPTDPPTDGGGDGGGG